MTTVEFFHRIGRHARTTDFTQLSMSELTDISFAANASIQETYNLLPAYYREITEGFALPGPQAITLAVVHLSSQLSSSVFTDEQIGRTVVLDGDPSWNQVIGTNALLNPYMGPTGTTSGVLYGDAWWSTRYPFDRIIGDPVFTNPSLGLLRSSGIGRANGQTSLLLAQQSVGLPCAWWPQYLGNSEGNEPLLVVKFYPAPNQPYSLRIRTSYWPRRLTPTNYNDASTLVIPDQYLETVLIPLAYRSLMSTPSWKSISRDDDDRILGAALRAEAFAKNQPGQPAAPRNFAYTPIGF